ncbi:radical SAM protein, partial [Nanoarchaeota archaeon]
PKLNEMIDEFHKRNITTFLVTNGQYPKELKEMKEITQLYLSLDAPTKELLKEIDKPLFPDYWERLLESLKLLSERKDRTCIRITLIKGMNDIHPDKYAELIRKANPDFIEVKGYMFVGASRQKLDLANMPYQEDIIEFSKKLLEYLPEYGLASEHKPSRAALLAKREFKVNNEWNTQINFEKFFEEVA